jgi:hypothetical protein
MWTQAVSDYTVPCALAHLIWFHMDNKRFQYETCLHIKAMWKCHFGTQRPACGSDSFTGATRLPYSRRRKGAGIVLSDWRHYGVLRSAARACLGGE